MNFELSQEQSLLKEMVERWLADHYGFEARRRLLVEPGGWSRDIWGQMAGLGLLAAPFAEADGGLGGGPVETLVVAEALGARLVAEPYLATVIMAGAALRLGANPDLRTALIPRIAAGETVLAFADGAAVPPRARLEGGTWRLDGAASAAHGDQADQLIVCAASDEGAAVFLVDAAAPGLARRCHRTFDGLYAAEIILVGVGIAPEGLIALGGPAEALIERVRQHAIAFLAAEAVGLMSVLLEATLEHLRTRKQFGRTLAGFQALQHRAVEMLIAIEQTRSMAIYAAMMIDDADALERRKAFAAVKAVIGASARFVGQNAVQLHGGVGVTEEHSVGWGLRRLTMIDMMLGDGEAWTGELARLGGFVEPAASGE